MAGARKRRSSRRRRGRFGGLYRFLAVIAVIAAVTAACVIFFRVNGVTVEGNSRYTVQEIVEASGIQTGDNLMTISKGQVASAIRTKLPYVEAVSIRRVFPDGVAITVRERVAAASVESSSGRWLISAQGKLLEKENGHSVIKVVGLKAQSPYAGGMIQVKDEDTKTLNYVLDLLTALEKRNMLSDCGELDCSNSSFLTVTWDIYTLKFPRDGDYGYMLRMLESVLSSEQMPQNEPGTFDFTVKDGEVYFRRKT